MEHKRGFAHPEILVGVVVIVLIAIIAYFSFSSSNESPQPPGVDNMENTEVSMDSGEKMMESEHMVMVDMPLTNTYVHPTGATLDYPDGWILDENPDSPSVVYKDPSATSNSGNGAGVLIITSPLSDTINFESFAKSSGESFGSQFGADAGEAMEIEINGLTAYMFEFPFTQGGVDLTANLYFVPGDGITYALFATSEKTLFEKYKKVLTDIIYSFKVS